MKHLAFFLVLILCFACRAEDLENKDNNRNDGDGPAESWDDDAQEANPRDIWTELSLLIHRVTVAEKLVWSLQEENSGKQCLPQVCPLSGSTNSIHRGDATFVKMSHHMWHSQAEVK